MGAGVLACTAVVEAGILKENCPYRKIAIKDNSNRRAK